MAFRAIAFFAGKIRDPYLLSALLAVLPLTEIKGSILYAASGEENLLLSAFFAYLASVLLSLFLSLIVPRLFLFAERHPRLRKVRALLCDRLASAADKISKRSRKGSDASETFFFGVYAFVALPLPLTGVYAGAILASILGLSFGRSFFALSAGNFTAGGIVLALALVAGEHASVVLDLFCTLILVVLLISFLKRLIKKRRMRHSTEK